MNLLISGNGQVLGQTYSADNAVRHAMVAKDKMYAVTRPNDLSRIDKCVGEEMLMEHGVTSVMQLWNIFKKQTFPYWGKVSVKKVVRTLYANGRTELTKDELMETIPGATWISITTAFSMLKNKKYAKPGKVLVIERKNGKYRRKSNE